MFEDIFKINCYESDEVVPLTAYTVLEITTFDSKKHPGDAINSVRKIGQFGVIIRNTTRMKNSMIVFVQIELTTLDFVLNRI